MSPIKNEFDVEASEPLIVAESSHVVVDDDDDQQEAAAEARFWQTIVPLFVGWNCGLFLQYCAVRARTYQLLEWRGDEFADDDVLYRMYDILSHADIVMCLIMWVYFVNCGTHRLGKGFHIGMCVLIGIICGSSVAWMSLDYILGFPVPMYVLALTFGTNVVACIMAIRFRKIEDDEEKDECD